MQSDDIDPRSEHFEDDSSGAMGLGHGFTTPDPKQYAQFASAHPSDPTPPHSQPNRDLVDPRWNEAENRRIERELRAAGLTPSEPGAASANAGAYEWIEDRTRELQAAGYSLAEATAIARDEDVARNAQLDYAGKPDEKPKNPDREYLYGSGEEAGEGREHTIEQLADHDKPIVGGGSRSGSRMKKGKPRPTFPRVLNYDAILSDERKPETEAERAARKLEENRRKLDRTGPGHPLKGKEPRMHVQGRMEPSKVADLNAMTGKSVVELGDDFHHILTQIRDGNDEEALAAVRELLVKVNEPQQKNQKAS